MKRKHSLLLFLIITVISGCKEKYDPPVIQSDLGALVVDGFINNSTDTTFIRVSRTKKLNEGVNNSWEAGAQLSIEDPTGNLLYNFQQLNDSGVYIVPGMNLDINNKYRLRIITSNGKQYLSDEVPVVKTPPIDSVGWTKNDKGLTIYVNTHDPQNKTLYYRWSYTEIWQYHAAYFSGYIYVGGGAAGLLSRTPDQYIYECWKTQQSSNLLLASSAKLAEDIIYQNPLRQIDLNGIELSLKYFMFLRQYAVTKEAYDYLENLRKITDQTGSIFDAQPSQVGSNIHAVNDPNETVLGYVMACTQEIKKVYITNDDVKPWKYQRPCAVVEIKPDDIDLQLGRNGLIPLDLDGSLYNLKGVYSTDRYCADCRLMGGILTKPDFWQ